MKQALLFSLCLLAAPLAANAQAVEPEAMNIETTQAFEQMPLNNVQRITFSAEDATMTVTPVSGTATTYKLDVVQRITFGQLQTTPTSTRQPAQTSFSIRGGETLCVASTDCIRSVRLVAANGSQLLVQTYQGEPTEVSVSLPALSKGIYVAVVETSAATVSQKVIINQ